jgi:hypothetical protein
MISPFTPERKPADWPAGYPSVSPDSDWPPISAADLPADILLPRLVDVREVGPGQWSACCPAHADGTPSLSITETEDFTLLVFCHAGCDIYDVMGAVGLQLCNLFPSDYAKFKAVQAGKRKSPVLGGAQRHQPAETSVPAHVIDSLTAHARACHEMALAGGRLEQLAHELRLPAQALADFGVGWHAFRSYTVYTFVERDGKGRVVGVLNRDCVDASKKCYCDSRRGLICSDATQSVALGDASVPLYIPEGHTDTIALHSCGCLAVGRAAAKLSVAAEHWLAEYLRARQELWQSRPIVVVGDNDDAGVTGARATAEMLAAAFNKPITCAFPPEPYKDMRDWITRGHFVPGWPVHSSTKDLVQS